jgi:flagellar protein FliS
LLFEQAAVNIFKAIKCINEKDICGAHNSIIKTQKIYAYLSDTLDLSFEISKDLYALYEFIQDRLAEANIKKDAGILSQVLSLTRDFKDTWKKAEIQSRACAHN